MSFMKIGTGLAEHGLSCGKQDLREAKPHIESNFFRDPARLLKDLILLTVSLVYSPIQALVLSFTRKPKSLRGKVAMVIGSGGGLGREMCRALALEGAVIVCADVNEKKNQETTEILSGLRALAKPYTFNVANKLEVVRTIEAVEAEVGQIYLLVNCAELCAKNGMTPTEDAIRAMFNVNILGPIWTMEALLKKMIERNEGHVANISSCSAFYDTTQQNFYGSTKAALTSYGQAMRDELANEEINNVHITTVHTGIINKSSGSDQRRLFSCSVEEVANYAVDAVRYDKGDCSTNPALYFASNIAKFLPVEINKSCMKLFNLHMTYWSGKETTEASSYDLVKLGNTINS